MKNMKRRLLSWLLMAVMVLAMLPTSVFAGEGESESSTATVPSVTVYFSMSEDSEYVKGKESGTVMALQKVTVPYFDLDLYGMKDFYFSSENYGASSSGTGSDLDAGTAEKAYGKITMLHLFIYATEVYYYGIAPSEAGKGYLYQQNLMGTNVLNCSGSAGAMFIQYIWGMDLNLNYYLNYAYPTASSGWGATADQILLSDGDVVTLGHFSSWSFYGDAANGFNYLQAGNDKVTTTVTQGKKLDLSALRAGTSYDSSYNAIDTLTPLSSQPTVYYTSASALTSGNVTEWTAAGQADANGKLSFDTSGLACGDYIFAVAGQYGESDGTTDVICSTPGAIRVTVTDQPQVMQGDMNGDGQLSNADVASLLSKITSGADVSLELGDMNGDGQISNADVAALLAQVTAG